jgi:hypothetical protein
MPSKTKIRNSEIAARSAALPKLPVELRCRPVRRASVPGDGVAGVKRICAFRHDGC